MTLTSTTTLAECEQVIRRGLLESSAALRTIRDDRLYREAGYSNFDTYCRDRLGIGRDMADRTIAAGTVLAELPTNVSNGLNEAHARALAPLRDDPDAMVEVLETVTSTGRVTAARIAEVVAERTGRAPLPAGAPTELVEHWVLDYIEVGDTVTLTDSIASIGLLTPVVVNHTGTVLVDGRARLAACRAAGVEPRYHRLPADTDIDAVAAALNTPRLTEGQRAMLAVDLADHWDRNPRPMRMVIDNLLTEAHAEVLDRLRVFLDGSLDTPEKLPPDLLESWNSDDDLARCIPLCLRPLDASAYGFSIPADTPGADIIASASRAWVAEKQNAGPRSSWHRIGFYYALLAAVGGYTVEQLEVVVDNFAEVVSAAMLSVVLDAEDHDPGDERPREWWLYRSDLRHAGFGHLDAAGIRAKWVTTEHAARFAEEYAQLADDEDGTFGIALPSVMQLEEVTS